MTKLQQLREQLNQGLYVDNLYEMASRCKSLALDADNPAPFFIMEHIFLDIARHWEDNPVTVEEAKLVEFALIQPLQNLINGLETSVSPEEVFTLLNRLVSVYLISWV